MKSDQVEGHSIKTMVKHKEDCAHTLPQPSDKIKNANEGQVVKSLLTMETMETKRCKIASQIQVSLRVCHQRVRHHQFTGPLPVTTWFRHTN